MRLLLLLSFLAVGCHGSPPVAPRAAPPPPPSAAPPSAAPEAIAPPAACQGVQRDLSEEANRRASPWNHEQHLAKNFSGGRVAWLMPEAAYQKYIVTPQAPKFGRCNDTGCYLFVAPAEVIERIVRASQKDGGHDAAAVGAALGLPAKNFEGPLRMMVLDIRRTGLCVRLPIDSDPGVWKCSGPDDTSCFKHGGYTAGGIPELMVIDAPVTETTITEIP